MSSILEKLNANTPAERLQNLKEMLPKLTLPSIGSDVNNHIHTTYSFSPYSPTAGAYMARISGLCTAGIMDHDTAMGAREFIAACEMLSIGGTCGLECRVSMDHTRVAGRLINNPDQKNVAYFAMHAIPHEHIEEVDAFFAPLRVKRNERNEKMVEKLNGLLQRVGIRLSFSQDVLPLSLFDMGGAVTERHIASALAVAIEQKAGRGDALVAFLRDSLGKPVKEKYAAFFRQDENSYFYYDLIGWIKAELIPDFYIDADEELPHVRDVLSLSERVSAISAYPYLGDITNSITGDKRAQKFEDDFLDLLFEEIKSLGFRAVTYMPARNTFAQVERVREKIRQNGFLEISGEDINQPRQPFVCEAMRDDRFAPLKDSAWALVAHERREQGLFHPGTVGEWPEIAKRAKRFAEIGKTFVGNM